jgi:hypothetical protein
MNRFTFMIIEITPKTTIIKNTMKTNFFNIDSNRGKSKVRSKADNQFVVTQTAIAELLSCCLKHSAVYINGIGPRPTAKLMIKTIMQTIDRLANTTPSFFFW